jgi:hypothetical protein
MTSQPKTSMCGAVPRTRVGNPLEGVTRWQANLRLHLNRSVLREGKEEAPKGGSDRENYFMYISPVCKFPRRTLKDFSNPRWDESAGNAE